MYRLAHWFLTRQGWRFEGKHPGVPRFVAVGAPHTSNLDFLLFLGVAYDFGFRASFVAKHSLFRWPFGGLMRRLGGIPVRRNTGQGLVEEVAAQIAASAEIALVIAPEGTRAYAPAWRTGFYRIAEIARVPIVACFVDYSQKRAGIGPALSASGDLDADMAVLRAFYADKVGRHPERMGPVTTG